MPKWLCFLLPVIVVFPFHLATAQNWVELNPQMNPSARMQAPMGFDEERAQVVLFGGVGTQQVLGDTWVWDGKNWTQKFPTTSPGSRIQMAPLVFDSVHNELVLYGGWNGDCNNDPTTLGTCNDTWVWNGSDWINKTPPTGNPHIRVFHAIAYDKARAKVVIYAGETPSGQPLGDTCLWDGQNWQCVSPLNTPGLRTSAHMAFDEDRNETVLFGGSAWNDNHTPLNDTWVWDGVNWTQRSPLHTPPAGPNNQMVWDSRTHKILLLVSDGETWTWDGTDWTELTAVLNSPPRTWPAVAYDRTRSQTVAFGGYANTGAIIGDTWILQDAVPLTGTINVSTNNTAATFIIEDENRHVFLGNGTSFEINGVTTGTYTVKYDSVIGFVTPASETKVLTSGGTITFTGTYIKSDLALNQNVLSFSYKVGFLGPISPQTVHVSSTGLPLSFSISVSTNSREKWLMVSPLKGKTPMDILVDVSNALAPGTYIGEIALSAPQAGSGTQNIRVTLVVTPQQTCGSATFDASQANDVIAATFTPDATACEGVLTITNQNNYWTNFKIVGIGSPEMAPVGGDQNLYAKIGVLPPKDLFPLPGSSPVSFMVKFTKIGQAISIFADPTIGTGETAGILNMVQATFTVVPGSSVFVGIDVYVRINAAFEQMPHLRNAIRALFSKSPRIGRFLLQFGRFAVNLDEVTTFVTLIRDLDVDAAKVIVSQFKKNPLVIALKILDALAAIFGELRGALFKYPAGNIILKAGS